MFEEYKNNKNNLILLTPYEHILAHKMLKEIFPCYQMTAAYILLLGKFKNLNLIDEQEYNNIIAEHAKNMSQKLKGIPKSEEHKKHISEGRIGLSYGPLSEEHKQKISKALKGRSPSELNRKINSEQRKQRIGEKNPRSKKILCVEDNLTFNTVKECCEYYHISNLHRYTQTGKIHTKLQKHFKYIEEDK